MTAHGSSRHWGQGLLSAGVKLFPLHKFLVISCEEIWILRSKWCRQGITEHLCFISNSVPHSVKPRSPLITKYLYIPFDFRANFFNSFICKNFYFGVGMQTLWTFKICFCARGCMMVKSRVWNLADLHLNPAHPPVWWAIAHLDLEQVINFSIP